MNLKVLFLILTPLLTIISFGQELTKAEIVKNKVRSVTTIDKDGKAMLIDFFDDRGNIIRSGSIGNNEKLQITREFLYNEAGQIFEERAIGNNGDITFIFRYVYNAQNQLVKTEHSDIKGDFSSFWTYEYDIKGNRVREVQRSATMGNSETRYKYNFNSLLTEEEKWSNTIGKEEKVSYKYNDKKQLVEKKTKHFFGGATITLVYSYNEIGKLIKLSEKSSNGVSSVTTYNYDINGLLISSIWRSSLSKNVHETTYKLSID
jgi:hypothetical protein